MIKQKIYHETIDEFIMKYLDAIGFENFHEIKSYKKTKEFFVKFMIEQNKFEVRFEIDLERMKIEKDTEFYGFNPITSKITEFQVLKRSNGSATLQELFNKYIYDYVNWKEEQEKDN